MRDPFYPFQLERNMSIWQNQVDYNLSDSGVQALTIADLLDQDPEIIEEFLSTGLGYPQTNGSPELRSLIADQYPGAKPDNVVVTTGAAQANLTTGPELHGSRRRNPGYAAKLHANLGIRKKLWLESEDLLTA